MQYRAAKQREIARRAALGKGGDTSPRSRSTEKRSLFSERERASEKGPNPGLYLGEQAGQHVVLIEGRDEDRQIGDWTCTQGPCGPASQATVGLKFICSV